MDVCKGFFLLIAAIATMVLPVYAQTANIELDVQLRSSITQAQQLTRSSLGIELETGRSSQPLADLIIRNLEPTPVRDLRFRVRISTQKFGVVTELLQKDPPFELQPSQIIVATNNDLQDGLPGISTRFAFDQTVDNVESYIETLGGVPDALPSDDIFSLYIAIIDASGQIVAEQTRSFGGGGSSGGSTGGSSTVDVFLLQPGEPTPSSATIATGQPVFRWNSSAQNIEYRLIVVEQRRGEDPLSLMQGASSTSPALIKGQQAAGQLNEFEMVDAIVDGTSFSWPANGVQKLEPGNTYYWQVFARLGTASAIEEIPSVIWDFTYIDLSKAANQEYVKELNEKLAPIMARFNIDFEALKAGGFVLESINNDGVVISNQQGILQEIETLQALLEASENASNSNQE